MRPVSLARPALIGGTFLAAVLSIVAWIAGGQVAGSPYDVVISLTFVGANLGWWLAGTVILTRARTPRIGWALILGALFGSMASAGWGAWSPVVLAGAPATDAAVWALLATGALYGPWFAALLLGAMIYFPDGRLPSARWRLPVAMGLGAVALSSVSRLVAPGPLLPGLPDNPLGLEPLRGLPFDALAALDPIGIAALALLGLGAMLARYRDADHVVRQQLKWLLLAVAPAALATPGSFFESDQTETSIADLVQVVALFLLMPASIGLAITRYHLYDIDRIISRSIGWAILTGLLVAVFAVVVIGLQAVLATVIQGQTLAVAASTLVAFALFQPVRRRVQRAVDRFFDRSHFDAERTAGEFAGRVRDEVDLLTIRLTLVGSVDRSVRPTTSGVWLRARADQ